MDSDELLLQEALAELLPELQPIEPAPERKHALRARLLQRVGADSRQEGVADAAITIHSHEGQWRPLAPGVQIKLLHADARVKSFLLKLAPGAEVPAHEHPAADEECMVLEGEAYIGDLRMSAGAYHLARKNTLHAGNLRSKTGATVLIHTGAGNPPRLGRGAL